jgi:DNA-binding NarL/FixJ family response regulator
MSGNIGARVLLIDDHPLVMDALASALMATRVFAGIEKMSSLGEAIGRLAVDADYALVITDLHMGGDTDGIEAVTMLRERFPELPVVVLSGDDRVETITAAFEAGIHGYITKDSRLEVLINALKLVMAGGCYLPRHAAHILGFEPRPPLIGQAKGQKPAAVSDALTPRQRQVFQLLLLGIPNKLIAARLDMAEGTVKTHLNTVYRVIGANNRAQAILRASELGLLNLSHR